MATTYSQIWTHEDLSRYNFGYSSVFEDYLSPKKATITEITDMDIYDEDWQDMDLDVDVLGKAFENVIDDWKIKMEVIIGDGLKKLRKSQKDRRLMMKYLPGNKKVQAAKEDIVKDWKIDFQKSFGSTHKKLEKLAAEKTKQVEGMAKSPVKKDFNRNKKKVIKMQMRANPDSAYGNLKQLIQDLDKMVNQSTMESPKLHSIPIYSKEARGQILPAYSNQWLDLQRSMLQNKDIFAPQQSFMDVLEDFKVKLHQEKPFESKKSKEHVLKEFQKNGENRCLVVRKKPVLPKIVLDVEDIFRDWKPNLEDIFEQRQKAALAARGNRKRKLSNRALRKELLKEIDEEEKKRPVSYADALKKNLKAPMEDIFEAWRDYLQELDEIHSNDSRTSFCKGDSMEDILSSADCYQKELANCGQPTVKTVKNEKPNYAKEIVFASWRHNLYVPQEYNEVKYQAENYFASWKYNLKTPEINQNYEEVEDIFEDCIGHFNQADQKVSRNEEKVDHKMSRNEEKMLKNKQRQQRRSKNKRNK